MGRPRVARTGWLSYVAYRLLSGLLFFVPRRAALALGGLAGGFAARHGGGEQGAVVAANLRHVLPDVSADELESVVRASFSSYGRYWAEVAKLGPGDARHLTSRFHVTGAEHVFAAHQRGGLLFALPHLGAWEVGGLWAKKHGFPLVTVAEDAASEALFAWFVKRRQRLGMRILSISSATSTELLQVLRAGGAVALVADRDVVGDGIEVEFFGEKTRVPAGPAVLAIRTGAALIPSVVYQDGAGYRAAFRAPIDTERRSTSLRADVNRVTADLVACFEEFIAAAPEQWHVFQPNWPPPNAAGGAEL